VLLECSVRSLEQSSCTGNTTALMLQAALTTLLEIGKSLPEDDYSRQVVPILTKLFASSDRGIRRGLLENITTYGPALPDKVVEEQVRPGAGSG